MYNFDHVADERTRAALTGNASYADVLHALQHTAECLEADMALSDILDDTVLDARLSHYNAAADCLHECMAALRNYWGV